VPLSGPEIDDRRRLTCEPGGERVTVLLEELAFGSRELVAGQACDPLEELAAVRVVEVAGRERTLAMSEPGEHVLEERGPSHPG
jgi:hypothetical protein